MNGTLEDTTPAGVLQVLSSQRSTGAVRFHGSSGCTVYLHRGELYFAESTETAEDLAVALVRPGRLTAEQWDASTDAGYPSESVGEELIATGGISRELLASVVLSVIYDPLIQLFRSPEGDYEFAPDVVHWIGPYRTFDVDAIVSEVRRRTREADEMAPVVPSLEAVVRSARTLPESHGSVNLRRDDWEVVIAAANGCTVNELAVELGRGRWSTARIVYRLANADLLMVTAEEADTVGGAATVAFDTEPAGSDASADLFAGDAFAPDRSTTDSFDTDSFGTDTFDPDSFRTDTFTADPFATGTDADTPAASDTTFGFDAASGPPPLDESLLEPSTVDDPDATDGGIDPDPWKLDEPADTGVADDTWGEFERTADSTESWDPSALYGDAPADTPTDDADDGWSGGLAAVPDTADGDSPGFDDPFGATPEVTDEPPALHPDIAKALAESTYADSATAINAMAARLGAIDADDDDDWDGSGTDSSSDDVFWSDGGGSDADDFIWKPAVWDTGVEAAPLPQREAARATGAPAGAPATDPAWLDNLYAEFMPGETKAAAPETESADTADPGAAPKQRTLRRLISAIRRL